jgi:DNA-binding CsgD family transcriptional regulator
MADLLNRLAKRKNDLKYVGKLLTAFRNEKIADGLPANPRAHSGTPASASGNDVMETMTKRELEIAALLVQRLSNKEIADKLYISPEIVKGHVYNIYQKLNVSTRREAAAKVSALGILKE